MNRSSLDAWARIYKKLKVITERIFHSLVSDFRRRKFGHLQQVKMTSLKNVEVKS
jgi:hypothetical protein